MNIADIQQRLISHEISVRELIQDTLNRISSENHVYNAFVAIDEAAAMSQACEADNRLSRGEPVGPLHGVPIGIKDIIDVAGMKTTMGSRIYRDNVAINHATVVSRLIQAGAIVIGKLHTHEFAYGPTGDKSLFGPAHNSLNPSRMTGGSSSGAGAAVALDWVALGLGTDTGGSIRIPAALCGVVGLKPTYGLVSKTGTYPLSSSLDHIGPLTKTVQDAATVLQVLAGFDELDATSVMQPEQDYFAHLNIGVHGLRIGIPTTHFWDPIDPEVAETVNAVIRDLEQVGAQVVQIDVPDMARLIEIQQAIQRSEAYAVHEEHMRTKAHLLGDEVRERLRLSEATKGYEYVLAKAEQRRARQAVQELFETIDCLVTPTVPMTAPRIDEREMTVGGCLVDTRTMLLKNTQPFNLTGHPALSIPCGFSSSGLPIGIQVVGPLFGESRLLSVGAAIESLQMFA